MNRSIWLFLLVCLAACNTNDNGAEETTGMLMEIEPSTDELNTLALQEKSEIIQDFFKINPTLLGTNFCYDALAVSDLILHDGNNSDSWSTFEISDNYLTLYNDECEVLLEFMTFESGGIKKAFLSQMNRSVQQFNYLTWNAATENWVNSENYPRPKKSDYFKGLNAHEVSLVMQYGEDFIYINPTEKNATFVFSDWLMAMALGEKQMDEFNKNADYDFELLTNGNRLMLKRVALTATGETSGRFLVAYSKNQLAHKTFRKKYDTLIASFSSNYLNTKLIHYGSNNFNVFFPTDTFNLRYMEQFEPRDGFWVYTYGKEPLDLAADEDIKVLVDKINIYFNEE